MITPHTTIIKGPWLLAENHTPPYDAEIDIAECLEDVFIPANWEGLIYMERRTCMMAGIAGGYGYFGEGYATDGSACESGLICDPPQYWRFTDIDEYLDYIS